MIHETKGLMDVKTRLKDHLSHPLRALLCMLLCVQLGLISAIPLPLQACADTAETEEDASLNAIEIAETTEAHEPNAIVVEKARFPTLDDYLKDNLEGKIIGDREDKNMMARSFSLFSRDEDTQFADSGHTLYMKYTLVDADIIGEDDTIDDVYENERWMEALLGQYDIAVDLLDPGEQSEYFIALADLGNIKGAYSASDYAFAELSNEGTLVDGPLFDKASGIAYIPKDLYFKDGEETPFALQEQLLIRVSIADEPATCFDVHVESADTTLSVIEGASFEASLFSVDMTFPIVDTSCADRIRLDDLSVYVNGSSEAIDLTEGMNASYDPATGSLDLFFAPINVFDIRVEIAPPSLLDALIPRADALTSSQSLAYVPDVVFDSLNLDTLNVGSGFFFETTADYWWPSSVGTAHIVYEACINSGAYCYSWVSNPDALYEYIAWTNGADWNGVAGGDVGNFPGITTGSSNEQRNYFNYVFWYGNMEAGGQNWHSERWPRNIPEWDSGQWGARFGLQCSHSKKPIGNLTHQGADGSTMWARVLEINTDVDRPYIVLGFAGPAIANQPGVGVYKFAIEVEGKIHVEKTSDLPDVTSGNPLYDLSLISYDVYADEGCTQYVSTITLDKNGHGESGKLKKGVYYLRERVPADGSSGYELDATVHTVTVSAGKVSVLNVSDMPQVQDVEIAVWKHDAELATNAPQGDASLAGAEFTISYYSGYFDRVDEALASGTPTRQWVVMTDETGAARFDHTSTASAAPYFTASGSACLPLGTVLIQETRSPEGYLLSDGNIYLKHIVNQGSNPGASGFDAITIDDEVMRGGLLIEKRDRESAQMSPLGAAHLDGTTFDITNESTHAVIVSGVSYQQGDVVETIVVKDGIAQTSPDALPYGSYAFQEMNAGEGYLLSDGGKHAFTISQDSQVISYSESNAVFNQVKRGDLTFVKMRSTDNKRLGNVPFRLTSTTTGESHILVTDENGYVNTASSWNAHTYKTNTNDLYAFGDGTVHEDGFDALAGVWFGRTATGEDVNPENDLGALPYDTYKLEELRCSANEHLELITLDEIKILRDSTQIDLGTIENRPESETWIATNARSAADGLKVVNPEKSVSIIDRVDYSGVEVGHAYRMQGKVVLQSNGQVLLDGNGAPIEASAEFTPDAITGYVELAFEFDALDLFGEAVVCFEELIDVESGEVIAEHKDLEDYDQTIRIMTPGVGTFATDFEDGDKTLGKAQQARIIDTVNYKNVAIGREYTFNGAVMKKVVDDDGEAYAEALVDSQGNPVRSSLTFVPESADGVVEVTFDLDASIIDDATDLVVFETLESDEREYVVHTDINNAAQTVSVRAPLISTAARDGQDGDQTILAQRNAIVIDSVSYEGLVPGHPYYAFGRLMLTSSGADGSAEIHPLLDAEGNKITASYEFTPEEEAGVVEVVFRFDASGLNGSKLVCFEEVYQGDALVASHADPNDAAQTVTVSESDSLVPHKPVGSSLPQTGDDPTMLHILIAFALMGAITTVIAAAARYRKG